LSGRHRKPIADVPSRHIGVTFVKAPELPPDESNRLQSLCNMRVVDTPMEERFDRITRLARRVLAVPIAGISLVESDRQWFMSIQGSSVTETSRDISFTGHAIVQDDVMIVPDARRDPRFADNPQVIGEPGIVFYAACPLKSPDGFNIGALCVVDTKPRELDESDIEALCDLAVLAESELHSAAANAVQAQLLESVSDEHRRAMIDGLTETWNRNGITQFTADALNRAKIRGHGIALIMVDVDRFKQINDTMGHAAGDEVLKECARRMNAAIRDTDILGRMGGDEFLIVLTEATSAELSQKIAERALEFLRRSPVSTGAGKVNVTASIGVHYVAVNAMRSPGELLKRADHALYVSKERGRNQVAMA